MDDWGGLENRCGLWATVGSNPTLSARLSQISEVSNPLSPDKRFAALAVQLDDPFNDIGSGAGKFSPVAAVQIRRQNDVNHAFQVFQRHVIGIFASGTAKTAPGLAHAGDADLLRDKQRQLQPL